MFVERCDTSLAERFKSMTDQPSRSMTSPGRDCDLRQAGRPAMRDASRTITVTVYERRYFSLSLKLIVTVYVVATARPFFCAGSNFHCFTAATAASARS